MGQKVHPYGFRLGFNKTWRSRWFAKQGYSKLLQEDLELKKTLTDRLKSAGVRRRILDVGFRISVEWAPGNGVSRNPTSEIRNPKSGLNI